MADEKKTDQDKGKESDKKPATQGDKSEEKDRQKDDAEDGKKSDAKDDADDSKGRTFTQEDVNRIVQQRLREEKEAADRKAKEKEARDKGEFEKLAATVTAERDDLQKKLTASTERNTALTEKITAIINQEIKALPESIRDLKPETDDVLLIADWLVKAKKSAAKMGDGKGEKPGDKTPGVGADPKAASKKEDKAGADKEAETALTSRFNYGF